MQYNFSTRERSDFNQALIKIPEDFLDQTVEWIRGYLNPEDVFQESVLEQWAYENGFKKFE